MQPGVREAVACDPTMHDEGREGRGARAEGNDDLPGDAGRKDPEEPGDAPDAPAPAEGDEQKDDDVASFGFPTQDGRSF